MRISQRRCAWQVSCFDYLAPSLLTMSNLGTECAHARLHTILAEGDEYRSTTIGSGNDETRCPHRGECCRRRCDGLISGMGVMRTRQDLTKRKSARAFGRVSKYKRDRRESGVCRGGLYRNQSQYAGHPPAAESCSRHVEMSSLLLPSHPACACIFNSIPYCSELVHIAHLCKQSLHPSICQ